MSARGGLLLLAVLLGIGQGCSRSDLPRTADPETSIAPPEPAALTTPVLPTPIPPMTGVNRSLSARVTLLSPGAPPRRPLRYLWRIGQKEQMTMDLSTSASTQSAASTTKEVTLPPVRIVLSIDPESVSPEGDLTYLWRVTSSGVTTDAQDPIADGMRAEVALVARLSGSATVTSRGLSKRVSIDPESRIDAGATGATGQMVEQVRETLNDIAAPFPEESVGRGGRWEKLSQIASRDAHITQTDAFTLAFLAPTGGTLDDVLAQTAPAQVLRAPGQPDAGGEARMDSMLASGDEKTLFDTSRLVPERRFDGTTTMVVSGGVAGSEAHRVTMVMRVRIVVKGTLMDQPPPQD